MAQPRHKGKQKQKQKQKPRNVVEASFKPVEETENKEAENVQTENSSAEVKAEAPVLTEKQQLKLAKEQAKKDKAIQKEKAKKKKEEARAKAGKVGLKQHIKETGSELKKVSWPSFKEVMKKTGIVIAVVLFFAVVLFAFDYLLHFLYDLLV